MWERNHIPKVDDHMPPSFRQNMDPDMDLMHMPAKIDMRELDPLRPKSSKLYDYRFFS